MQIIVASRVPSNAVTSVRVGDEDIVIAHAVIPDTAIIPNPTANLESVYVIIPEASDTWGAVEIAKGQLESALIGEKARVIIDTDGQYLAGARTLNELVTAVTQG